MKEWIVRTTKEIQWLFFKIDELEDEPDRSKTGKAIRALSYAAYEAEPEELKRAKLATRDRMDDEWTGEMPVLTRFMIKDSLSEEVYKKYREVYSETKNPRMSFMLRESLQAYYNHLCSMRWEMTMSSVAEIMDPLVFKQEYELSDFPDKETLFDAARPYLEKSNPRLCVQLREKINNWIRSISDYYNFDKYFPKRRGNFGKTNIIFITKVFCGLLLTLYDGEDLYGIIQDLW